MALPPLFCCHCEKNIVEALKKFGKFPHIADLIECPHCGKETGPFTKDSLINRKKAIKQMEADFDKQKFVQESIDVFNLFSGK